MSIELSGVTIAYGTQVAVADASFVLPRGAVGLLGRNGAGKTSILRALLGLVRPAAGTMRILDLPQDADPREVRRRVGYMPERDCWIPGLNGFETVALAGQLSGLPERQAFRRAHEVLWLVGLEEQRYRAVAGYSTGMRQKVKLATALVHDPDLLFLDEPTNGLDPGGRVEMLDLIGRMANELGKSVVLSSHILQDVERTCGHVVLMERGKVLASGAVGELTRHARRAFDLVVEGCPAERLVPALTADGVLAVTDRGSGRLALEVGESFSPAVVFGAVQACGGVVRRLVEQRRSLEDVFLGAVRAGAEVG
ncbi:MAG TPA: ABC transporter ATP-binding protein [Planctomycetota bacterium]|nr:ABC transporter ATP-binding protein [Planctomycetota bacterium]